MQRKLKVLRGVFYVLIQVYLMLLQMHLLVALLYYCCDAALDPIALRVLRSGGGDRPR